MPENTVEILVRVRDEATRALGAIQTETFRAGTVLDQFARPYQSLATTGRAVNEQLALTEGTTRGLTRAARLATIEVAQGLNPTLGAMVGGLDRAALAAQLTGGRLAGMAAGATILGTGLAIVIERVTAWHQRNEALRLSLQSVDLPRISGEIGKLAEEYRKLSESLGRVGPRGLTMEQQAITVGQMQQLNKELQAQAVHQGRLADAARETALAQQADVFTGEDASKVRKQFLEYAVENVAAQNTIRAALQRTLQVQADLLRSSPTAGLQEELDAREKVRRVIDLQIISVKALAEAQAKADIYHAPQIRAAAAEVIRGLQTEQGGLTAGDRMEWDAATGTFRLSTTAERARRVALGAMRYQGAMGSEELVAEALGPSRDAFEQMTTAALHEISMWARAARERVLSEALAFDPERAMVEGNLVTPAQAAAGAAREAGLAASRVQLASLTADRVTAMTQEQQALIRVRDLENELLQIRIVAGREGIQQEESLALGIRAANVELERQRILFEELVRTDPMVGLRVGLDESIERLTSWGDTARSVVHDTADAMGLYMQDLFLGRFTQGLKGLEQFALRTWSRVASDLATSAILQQVRTLLGGGGGLPLGFNPAGAAGFAGAAPTGTQLSLQHVYGASNAWRQSLGLPQMQGAYGAPYTSEQLVGFEGLGTQAGTAGTLLGKTQGEWAQMIGGGLAVLGGGLGVYAGFRQAQAGNAWGIASAGLGGLTMGLGAAALGLGPAMVLGPIGLAVGLGVAMLGSLFPTGRTKKRLTEYSARAANRVLSQIEAALPHIDADEIGQLIRWAETDIPPDDPMLRALLIYDTAPDGSTPPLSWKGGMEQWIGSQWRLDLIETLTQAQESARPFGAFLLEEALAPGLSRFEALAGTGPRQRAQAIQAIRRGAVVEIINAMGPDEAEALITKMRDVAELRAIPILPRARFVEILG